VLILIGLLIFYYLNKVYSIKNENSVNTTLERSPSLTEEPKIAFSPTPEIIQSATTPQSETEMEEAKKVVEKFESLHMKKDEPSVLKMFELFTPPESSLEKEFYDFLLAKDNLFNLRRAFYGVVLLPTRLFLTK